MAEKIVRGTNKSEPAAKPAAKTVNKAAETVKETTKKPAAKQQTVITPNKPTGGSTVGLRIGAVILWILALACEAFAIMTLLEYFIPPFNLNAMTFLIIMIVLDMALAIIAAQLWKKANHIKPMSQKRGKFLFYLWNELGVIMACICFIPLIILLLKNDKLDKRTKTITAIVAVVALLITGAASADYDPITAEEKQQAETQISDDVYWTQFGHKYHLNADEEGGCPYIRSSSTLYKGTVTEAIEAGRTAICSYCATHYASEMGLDLTQLNVEGGAVTEGD